MKTSLQAAREFSRGYASWPSLTREQFDVRLAKAMDARVLEELKEIWAADDRGFALRRRIQELERG